MQELQIKVNRNEMLDQYQAQVYETFWVTPFPGIAYVDFIKEVIDDELRWGPAVGRGA